MVTGKLLERLSSKFKEGIINNDEISTFLYWLKNAELNDIYQINVYELADELKIDRNSLLLFFIDLAEKEFFDINWEYHCPACNGVPETHKFLSEVSNGSSCQMCKVSFDNILDSNVGISFSASEEFVEFTTDFFDSRKKALEEAVNAPDAEKTKIADFLQSRTYVSGMDCLHIPSFKKLFDEDNLPFDESLKIKNITILFTDIKGSTALYNRVGDAKAYRLIREHFEILFDIIENNGGIIIKTIGDAVMASFKSPIDAIKSSLSIEKEFKEFDTKIESEKEFLVKMGIHKGPSIMVTLNNRIDFFGQTVNVASRIQNLAKNNEILISERIKEEKEVLKILKQEVKSLTRKRVKLKGIEEESNIYQLNLK